MLKQRTSLFLCLAALAVALAALPVVGQITTPLPTRSGAETQKMTLADLPLLGRYAISAAVGKDQPAYHVVAADEGFRATHPGNGLVADFDSRGVMIQAGTPAWDSRSRRSVTMIP